MPQLEAFSNRIIIGIQRHDVEDKPISPEELAARFCSTNRPANEFWDVRSVLRGARHMVKPLNFGSLSILPKLLRH